MWAKREGGQTTHGLVGQGKECGSILRKMGNLEV